MQVFISHAGETHGLVRRIAKALEEEGLRPWDPYFEVLPGDNMPEMAAQALTESQAMVVLLTPESLKSRWVQSDIDYAIGHMSYANRLVPVIVGDSGKFHLPDDSLLSSLFHHKGSKGQRVKENKPDTGFDPLSL